MRQFPSVARLLASNQMKGPEKEKGDISQEIKQSSSLLISNKISRESEDSPEGG